MQARALSPDRSFASLQATCSQKCTHHCGKGQRVYSRDSVYRLCAATVGVSWPRNVRELSLNKICTHWGTAAGVVPTLPTVRYKAVLLYTYSSP